MATKEREIEMMRSGDGCLGKAAPDEPLFILRAQDKFAPLAVLLWAQLVEENDDHSDSTIKIAEARELALDMKTWQTRTGRRKRPD